MKLTGRVIIALYIVMISFLLMNLFLGDNGYIAYQELEKYRVSLTENINELQNKNSGLASDSALLMTQTDEIKIQARELGYFDSLEGVIKLNGYNKPVSGYSMGKLLSRELVLARKNNEFVVWAVFMGLLFYVSSTFLTKYMKKR